jgi:polysaccharide biosynthesis protein PslJ
MTFRTFSGKGLIVAQPASTSTREGLAERQRFDVVSLLTLYILLLMAIPSSLVFSALGAAGGPSTLCAVALLVYYLVVRRHPYFNIDKGYQPVRLAGVLFICSILASYASANRHYLPVLLQNGADRGLISVLGWLAVLLMAADGIDSKERLMTLLSRITTGAACLGAIGIAQFFSGVNYTKYILIPGLAFNQPPTDLLVRGSFDRPSATAAQPLEFAALMAMAFPIAIHQLRFAPPENRRRRWVKLFIIGAAIPMTVSRTALIGLAVIVIVLLPTWPKKHRRYAYYALLASVFGVLILVPRLLQTFVGLFAQVITGSASTDSRTSAIGAALPYIAQHPWLGSGFGTFLPQVYFFTDDQYLNSLITTGAIGLCCLIGLFVTGWLAARSVRCRSRDLEVRDMAQCLAAAVAVAAVCFGTFDVLGFAIASGLTFLILGCVGAAFRLWARGEVQPGLSSRWTSITTDDGYGVGPTPADEAMTGIPRSASKQ